MRSIVMLTVILLVVTGFNLNKPNCTTNENMVISNDYILSGPLEVNNLTIGLNAILTMRDGSKIIIHGDLMVNGHIADQGSELEFTGTDQQVISGNGSTITLYNITDSNTSSGGLLCENDINLIGTLKLNENAKIDVDGASDDKKFTLVSNAQGTARIATVEKGAEFSGKIISQQFIDKGMAGWRYIGVSVKDQTLSSWNDDIWIQGVNQLRPNGWPNVYYYVEEIWDKELAGKEGWRPIKDINDPLKIGTGYEAFFWSDDIANTITIDNQGKPFLGDGIDPSGTYYYSISKTDSAFDHGGWNLISNVYPCELDWNSPDFVHYDVNDFSVWNSNTGSYGAYNGIMGTNGCTQYIASSKSFFIHANSARSEIYVNEHAKAIFNGNTYLGSVSPYENVPKFRLKIGSEDGFSDEAAFAFVEGASDGLDKQFDALKLNGKHINLASLANDNKTEIAINVMNTLAGIKRSMLRVKPCQSGNYVFDVTQYENIPKGAAIILVDHYKRDSFELDSNSHYKFFIDLSDIGTYDDSRFELLFMPPKEVVSDEDII